MASLTQGLYYAYPATVLAYFTISSGVAATLKSYIPPKDPASKTASSQKGLIALLFLVLAGHLAHLVWLFAITAKLGRWPSEEYVVVGRLSAVLVFGLQLSQLFDLQRPVWYPFYGSWILAAVFEAAIGSLTLASNGRPHVIGLVAADLFLTFFRFALLISMLTVIAWQSRSREGPDEEQQPLLKGNGTAANGHERSYGSTDQTNGTHEADGTHGNVNGATNGTTQKKGRETRWERRERIAREAMEKRLAAGGNWFQYAKEFKVRVTTAADDNH